MGSKSSRYRASSKLYNEGFSDHVESFHPNCLNISLLMLYMTLDWQCLSNVTSHTWHVICLVAFWYGPWNLKMLANVFQLSDCLPVHIYWRKSHHWNPAKNWTESLRSSSVSSELVCHFSFLSKAVQDTFSPQCCSQRLQFIMHVYSHNALCCMTNGPRKFFLNYTQ